LKTDRVRYVIVETNGMVKSMREITIRQIRCSFKLLSKVFVANRKGRCYWEIFTLKPIAGLTTTEQQQKCDSLNGSLITLKTDRVRYVIVETNEMVKQ